MTEISVCTHPTGLWHFIVQLASVSESLLVSAVVLFILYEIWTDNSGQF